MILIGHGSKWACHRCYLKGEFLQSINKTIFRGHQGWLPRTSEIHAWFVPEEKEEKEGKEENEVWEGEGDVDRVSMQQGQFNLNLSPPPNGFSSDVGLL